MKIFNFLTLCLLLAVGSTTLAQNVPGKHFDRVIFVVFENTNYDKALKQDFFKRLAQEGVHFTNFSGESHPSQANYIAMTSGDSSGVWGDSMVDLDRENIVDRLEAASISWRVYAEDFPENCYLGKTYGKYVRKHNPFISYTNIQNDLARCSHIVSASKFYEDFKNENLPQYVFYIPNMKNDDHDSGVAFADRWYKKNFSPVVDHLDKMPRTLLITTFDESHSYSHNDIYTSIVGAPVRPQEVNLNVNHCSLLKMVEDNWNLPLLGPCDTAAASIPDIWNPRFQI